jgi:hypothetical protein
MQGVVSDRDNMKKIGIIGTRKRNIVTDFHIVNEAFKQIYEDGDWIVSGHCPKGGDAFAEKIAYDNGIPILLFPPKKKIREFFFARNTLVAEASDIIIACLINPHESLESIYKRTSGGTEDTIRKFLNKIGYHKFHSKENIPIPDEIKEKVIIV